MSRLYPLVYLTNPAHHLVQECHTVGVLPDDPLLIPVWVLAGSKRHQRRPGVLLEWEIREGRTWWGLVAETRGIGSFRQKRVSWHPARSLQEIKG
jgi:hypothetical protein